MHTFLPGICIAARELACILSMAFVCLGGSLYASSNGSPITERQLACSFTCHSCSLEAACIQFCMSCRLLGRNLHAVLRGIRTFPYCFLVAGRQLSRSLTWHSYRWGMHFVWCSHSQGAACIFFGSPSYRWGCHMCVCGTAIR